MPKGQDQGIKAVASVSSAVTRSGHTLAPGKYEVGIVYSQKDDTGLYHLDLSFPCGMVRGAQGKTVDDVVPKITKRIGKRYGVTAIVTAPKGLNVGDKFQVEVK